MKQMKQIKRILPLVWLLAGGGALFAQTDLQPAAIVRLTKSEPITVKQLKAEIEQIEKQAGKALNSGDRRQILDVMINERLALQAAERDKITVAETEITQQMQQLRAGLAQQIGRQPTDGEFAAALRNETGLDLPAFREQLRRQLIAQKYLLSKKENLLKSVKTPTEAEIVNAYTLNKTYFVRPETVGLSMIMMPYSSDAGSKAQAKEQGERLIREIGANPSKFDEAAVRGQAEKEKSLYRSGNGYLPRNSSAMQYVGQDLMDTAFALRQGEVSRLVEGPAAFYIVKVIESHEQKNLSLDDIFQLGSPMTVREYIGGAMFQERRQAALKQASDELIQELRRGNPFQIMESNLNW
ncbi:MAG: peptidyl-prolyl cis-trans isomerase [Spirochaetaceae bacterium]|jgi:parvulin-like peptidyl-prolyl isomerase|nr:peptidyl-prolyl cis-trans isomerase [Spirochaetaceae bacterium]